MLLEVRNVNTYYGNIHALKGVSLEVDRGEIVTVIGANGAGKTTLLNTISGVLHARTGELLLDGQRITKLSPDKVVRLGISQVPERRQVFSTLNVITWCSGPTFGTGGIPARRSRKTWILCSTCSRC
jgi:branched-chain amino acid transport system ATP-binding protein